MFEPSPTPEPSPAPEPTRNPVPPRAPLPANLQINRAISNVNITFYDCVTGGFCGHMYNGEPVYMCDQKGKWIGIVYTRRGGDCNVMTPWPVKPVAVSKALEP